MFNLCKASTRRNLDWFLVHICYIRILEYQSRNKSEIYSSLIADAADLLKISLKLLK